MGFTVRNHYVPQWYQRRFFEVGSGQSHLHYLDLNPDPIRIPGGVSKRRTALRKLGPVNCFKEDHLYTLFFGQYASDVIERRFFGDIDRRGEAAVAFFSDYKYSDDAHSAFHAFTDYLAAQLFRTPKGLRLLQTLARTKDHQQTLIAMERVWQIYQTIWCEGVWEIFSASSSPTKFILTDSPVTTYNPMIFPQSAEMRNFGIAPFERVGTRLLFPLDRDRCLCITNLQLVRNPRMNPQSIRENPRYFGQGLFDLRKIQRGREIEEAEVVALNFILKSSALRYIAAPQKEWLHPEDRVTSRFWPKVIAGHALGPDPRKVSFTTAIFTGGGSGPSLGTNEYGHYDIDHPRAKKLREVEWKTFQGAKAAWDERDRRLGRAPPADLKDYW